MRALWRSFLGLAVAVSTHGMSATAQTWVGTWAASQQIPEPQNALPSADLLDATLRETAHVSRGGAVIRVHLSNAFGTTPLHLTAVHVARPVAAGSSEVDRSTDRPLLFNGLAAVIIPPGADYVSDPIQYPLSPLADLTVSLHVESEPGQQTGHPGSRQTTFYAHGDLTGAAKMAGAKSVEHWYTLSGIDVQTEPGAYSIVVLGDSITDGHGTTTNANNRWTDVLARRLAEKRETHSPGVLNGGIGGNHLLTDGLGPNALARFDRDVLAQAGVRYLLVLEGINDLGGLARDDHAKKKDHGELVHRMIGAYQQLVARAHAHGIQVYGATIMPDHGSAYYHPDALSEEDRKQVNSWIREAGHFDAVVDFDSIMADPADPQQLLPAFDSGDHLHPGPAGYKKMGESVPLSLFK